MTAVVVLLAVVLVFQVVTFWWPYWPPLRPGRGKPSPAGDGLDVESPTPPPGVEPAGPGPDFFDVGDGNDWRRLPFEITRAVENPAGPGVIVEQLTPGLGLAIDPATDEAVILEQGSGELVRFPMYRLRDIDPALLLDALDDPTASAAAARGDLLVEAKPNGSWVKAWVRGDEGRHWGVHRSLAVPGWPWAEE